MSERNDILTLLQSEIEDTIESANVNYSSDIAEVKRGIHYHNDTVNRPFIGISLDTDELLEETFTDESTIGGSSGNNQWRQLVVKVYCFMSVSLSDYDAVHTMIKDLEYFLKYDFTHNNYTTIGNVRIIEGGISYPVSYFDIDVQIQYMSDM